MFKNIFLLMCALFIGIQTLNGADFKNIQSQYFYQKSAKIMVDDWSPATSDNFYVSISTDNGLTWKAISDTLSWGPMPALKTIEFIPNVVQSGIKFGLFVNPKGIWSTSPISTYTTNFVTSFGIFTSVPDTIFNNGTYTLTTNLMSEQLPSEIQLQYTLDGMEWHNLITQQPTDVLSYTFVNDFINNDVVFRYVYLGTEITIAETQILPFQQRDTYFYFLTEDKNTNINNDIHIKWTKSYNFTNITFKVLIDGIECEQNFYTTNDIDLNLNTIGLWSIVGIAENVDFIITDTLKINVIDPYINLIKQIDSLNNYIKENMVIKLIYQNGTMTDVKDIKKESEVINILLNADKILITGTNISYWIYSLDGGLIKSEYYNNLNNVDVSYLPAGVYFFYVHENNKYTLYKFIK